MKKIFWGYVFLAAVILTGNSFLGGCGSSSTAPVTVTQSPTLCAGSLGYAYLGSSNSGITNVMSAGGVSVVPGASVTAYSLGLFIYSAGSIAGPIRGAIYAGTVAGPTTLLVQSAPQSVVMDAWNEIQIPSTALSPGFYWLSFLAQNAAYCASDLSVTTGHSFTTTSPVAYGPFPSTMAAGATYGTPLNYYVSTCP